MDIGHFGEEIAAKLLVDSGYVILDRNWRSSSGELDIVATKDSICVIVEVKSRRSSKFGVPEAAVNPVKLSRIRILSRQWLADHSDISFRDVRIDVISVYLGSNPVQVVHLEDVE